MENNKDVLLDIFVSAINEVKGVNIPITLNTGGAVLSGNLISFNEYIDLVSKKFEDADDESGIGKVLAESLSLFTLDRNDGKEDKKEGKKDYQYIHLKDVRILSGTEVIYLNSIWRGKLSAIDGFNFGLLERK